MDYTRIPSPCYVLDEARLIKNLQTLQTVQQRAGVEIILAFKGFAMWSVFPQVRRYLVGATASSLHEAQLCWEEMKVKAHTYCVAYKDAEFEQIAQLSSHLSFNSLGQWERFKNRVPTNVSCGLRVNPQWSDVETALYNPASPSSRLGVGPEHLAGGLPEGIEGLHFHVLCESDSSALEKVLVSLESKFGHLLSAAKWLNIGGGHLMTRDGYDLDHLVSILTEFKTKHDLHIIMEPGSAVAWQTGDLRSTILDIVENGKVKTIIPDISFTCHMPDCLEMPYRPEIKGASQEKGATEYQYRVGGISCLAGDFIEEYSFSQEPQIGDPLVFEDMIHYTTVKTTTFNGVQHPSIGIWKDDSFQLVKRFGFEDFRNRLS